MPVVICYREGGKLRRTSLPVDSYSIVDPPQVIVTFVNNRFSLRRYKRVKYESLTESSKKRLPLPQHVQAVLNERRAIYDRKLKGDEIP